MTESSIFLILEIGFLTSKSCNTYTKKNQGMSICGLIFACTGTGTFNESIRERTVRQTDQQKLWLYLAAFRCQTTKQSYKIIK